MIKAAALLVVLALAGALYMQWRDWPRPLTPTGAPGSGPGAAVPGPDPNQTPVIPGPPEGKETYATVAERTLFRPQRKPEPPQPAEAAPEAAAAPDGTLEGLDLTAVLIAPGVATAWIKEPTGPELKRLRLGDEQGGWSVKAIQPDRIVFERQGETNELILQDFSQPLPAPPAVAPPARPNQPNQPGRPGQPPGPKAAAPRPGQPPTGIPQRAQNPVPGQRGAVPTTPQSKPNVRRPLPQRPQ